jgi:hypothetical protein
MPLELGSTEGVLHDIPQPEMSMKHTASRSRSHAAHA